MRRDGWYWAGMIIVIIALWNIQDGAIAWAVFGLALALTGIRPDDNLRGRH